MRASSSTPPESGGSLSPDEVSVEGLRVVTRGYDRARTERLLARVRESYGAMARELDVLRERLERETSRADAAASEAAVSARTTAEHVRRTATLEGEIAQARAHCHDLRAMLELALSNPSAPLPARDDGDGASSELASATRIEVEQILARARQELAELSALTEQQSESARLAEERRRNAERIAAEVIQNARADAAAAMEAANAERERVREVLRTMVTALVTDDDEQGRMLDETLVSLAHDTAVQAPPSRSSARRRRRRRQAHHTAAATEAVVATDGQEPSGQDGEGAVHEESRPEASHELEV